jgi:hypothetical protein
MVQRSMKQTKEARTRANKANYYIRSEPNALFFAEPIQQSGNELEARLPCQSVTSVLPEKGLWPGTEIKVYFYLFKTTCGQPTLLPAGQAKELARRFAFAMTVSSSRRMVFLRA